MAFTPNADSVGEAAIDQSLLPAAADDATSASCRNPHEILGCWRQNLWTHGTWSEAEGLVGSLVLRDQSNL